MYKIVVGIPAYGAETIIDKELEDNEDIWCDFSVEHSDNGYYLSFETMLGFEKPNGCRDWILHCLAVFTEYMINHGFDITRELDMYEVFTRGVGADTHYDEIEDLYALMKLLVLGFHGDGLFVA